MLRGTWTPLASTGTYPHPSDQRLGVGGKRKAEVVTRWGAWVPLHVKRGDKVLIESRRKNTAEFQYVVSIVRTSGTMALVTLSDSPLPDLAKSAPTPSATFSGPKEAPRRNIRVCEECEGPCRAGAKLCDTCKEAASG